MRILPPAPGIEDQSPEARKLRSAIGGSHISDGMLHPGIGSDDEKSAGPRAEKNQESCPPVSAWSQALFAKQEETQKRRFQEKSEDTFHGKRLPNDSSRKTRKVRPIGAELK